jgi:hypothetical protein
MTLMDQTAAESEGIIGDPNPDWRGAIKYGPSILIKDSN